MIKKLIIAITVLVLFTVMCAGCGETSEADANEEASADVSAESIAADTTTDEAQESEAEAETAQDTSMDLSKTSLMAMPEEHDGAFGFSTVDGGVSLTKYYGEEDIIIIPSQHEGKDVVKIGVRAFFCERDIKAVLIPETVTKIGDEAFSGCESLEVVYFKGEGIKEICSGAFSCVGNLKYIELPESIDTFGGVFTGVYEIVTVVTPSGSYAETFFKDFGVKFIESLPDEWK